MNSGSKKQTIQNE
jgi:hypothetical protein